MNGVVFTQYSADDFRQIIRDEIRKALTRATHTEKETSSKFLTMDDASKYLSISKSHLYKLTSNQSISHSKRGKRIYFVKSELEKWLLDGKVKTMEERQKEVTERIYSKKNRKRG